MALLTRLKRERELIGVLDGDAQIFGFLDNTYFVETSRALSIPAYHDPGDAEVSYLSFYSLSFEGVFKCFSKVQIGRVIGASSVRALCLTFDNTTVLPYFDGLPDDHLFHVPVLAVNSIDKTN